MNAANFHEYLKNPSMLHQVNYQELKSLSLQYPYAANLRYLMLVKSLMENKREYDRNLVLASLSSIDRKKLHELVVRYNMVSEEMGNYEIVEEFLELKDLSTLEEVLDSEPSTSEELKQQAAPLSNVEVNNDFEFLDNFSEEVGETGIAENLEEEAPPADVPVLEELIVEEAAEEINVGEGETEGTLFENEPSDSIEEESIEEQGFGNLEELENEGSQNSQFVVEEEPEPVDWEEGPDLETVDDLLVVEQETVHEEIRIDEAEDIPLEETIEELAASSTPAKDVPFEITNDDPILENNIEDLDVHPKPSPKTAFSSYQKVQPHKSGIFDVDLEDLKMDVKGATPPAAKAVQSIEDYKEPEDVAKKVAASSISEDNSIATETLAGILERQGHFDKAIKMYEKLSLQFPEKSSTFAAKIEKLRKK